MAFIRIKIIKKNGRTYRYRYLQRNVRIGKKVKSFMIFMGVVGSEMIRGPENKPLGKYFQDPKETPGQKMQRDFLKSTAKPHAHEAKSERQKERAEAEEAADKKFAETMEAVREFNEARVAEKGGKPS